MAELLYRILEVTLQPTQYITDSKRDSPLLESLIEDFPHVALELQIFSFYKTIETYFMGTPVKKVSNLSRYHCFGLKVQSSSQSELSLSFANLAG